MIHMIHMIHTRKIVGHIFGTNVGITTLAWSTHPQKLVTFLGQIPGQMWEYTNTFVTYDTYGT